MNPFEYVIILSTLILGLGVSQVLVGVSNLITNKKNKVEPSPRHDDIADFPDPDPGLVDHLQLLHGSCRLDPQDGG